MAPRSGTTSVHVGCEFVLEVPAPVAAVFQVEPTPDRRARLLTSSMTTDPTVGRTAYTDTFGNACTRLELQPGPCTLRYDARFAVPVTADEVDPDAREMPVTDVPDDVLLYLMPSRFCVSDVLADRAFELFAGLPTGWRRVQAIVEHVHEALTFGYGSSSPTTTAADAYDAGKGVCRDFAHVAIAFCRALNIPARYVFGYLPDIDIEPDPAPMDFAAWCEVWLDGRWWTFDPRNHQHRVGRVVIGRGRDAVDVAMLTSYGAAKLQSMTVWADEERT